MQSDEEYINSRLTKGTKPFTVPEGYFDSLANRVLSQIPADTHASSVKAAGTARQVGAGLRIWHYAAAIAAVAVIAATVFFGSGNNGDGDTGSQLQAQTNSYDYFDEAADYAMLDNQDIYACLLDDY